MRKLLIIVCLIGIGVNLCHCQNRSPVSIVNFCEHSYTIEIANFYSGNFYCASDSMLDFTSNGESGSGSLVCTYTFKFSDSLIEKNVSLNLYDGHQIDIVDIFILNPKVQKLSYLEIDTISAWCYKFKCADIIYNNQPYIIQSMEIKISEFEVISCSLWINKNDNLSLTNYYFLLLNLGLELSVE
jgi:hypothetical protein